MHKTFKNKKHTISNYHFCTATSCDIVVFFSTNLYINKLLFTSFANELIKHFDLIASLFARLYFLPKIAKFV